MDAKNLKLSTELSLIVISGVGGELSQKIVQGILSKNANHSKIDFIIAANNKSFHVRSYLKGVGYRSFREELVFENKIGYEVIYSKYLKGDEFDLAGKKIFDLNNIEHHQFLEKKVDHFKKKSAHDRISKILLKDYSSILKR